MFELWDLASRNAVATFRTREGALAAVREYAASHGARAASSLLLGYEDESGRSTEVARGGQLMTLAQAAVHPPSN